ncbi:hypothetical protein B0H21DRAFT_548298 [Amylocystis lapponica]|nr:hypothetical protein B0H21DRAFT_548298 [Amylocystis lapponica]
MYRHRALDIHEILCHVFEQIDTHRDPSTPKSNKDICVNQTTLVSSACVCRAFSEPALRALWREIHSLIPLFKLFSISVVRRTGDYPALYNEEYVLDGEILPDNFARFQRYARLVRTAWHTYVPIQISPSLFSAIERYQDGLPLLPSLRELVWIQKSCQDQCLLSLLSPSLRILHLDLRGIFDYRPFEVQGAELQAFLKSAQTKSIFLQELHFTGIERVSSLELVSGWKHLSSLQLLNAEHTVNERLVRALSHMQHLADLSLSFGGAILRHARYGGFPALQDLKLRGDLRQLVDFLDIVASPVLRDVQLVSGTTWSNLDQSELSDACARHASLQALTFKHLTDADPTAVDTLPELSFLAFVRPLLRLRSLHELSFYSPGTSLLLSGADLLEIAAAWPDVTALTVRGPCRAAQLSLRTIAEFTQRCPALHELALPAIDDAPLAGPGPEPAVPVSSALRRLELYGTARPAHPERLALKLAIMFPELEMARSPYTVGIRNERLSSLYEHHKFYAHRRRDLAVHDLDITRVSRYVLAEECGMLL